ncbi:MAG: flavodoxin family protein [Chloroflexi bacterium]|nr:flavodoxin family protein [Chloroflexota bacterium]
MRALIVVDHPWPESFSYTTLARAQLALVAGSFEVDVIDLHRDGFDPVLRVDELAVYTQGQSLDPKVGDYQARITQAQHLVFIFPVWWEVMPAMLKGFFDKVFLPGWAFADPDATPLLTHIQTGTAITTMSAPQVIHTSVEPVLCKGILEFAGVQRTRWFNLLQVSQKSTDEKAVWLAEIEAYLRAL